MTQEQVVALMKSCVTEEEWFTNSDRIKDAFGGEYPCFWHSAIMQSGLMDDVTARWGGNPGITVRPS